MASASVNEPSSLRFLRSRFCFPASVRHSVTSASNLDDHKSLVEQADPNYTLVFLLELLQ